VPPWAAPALEWDSEVSRVHAELVEIGGAWTVSDDGLSRNGSYRSGGGFEVEV